MLSIIAHITAFLAGTSFFQLGVKAQSPDWAGIKCYVPDFAKSINIGSRGVHHPFADSRIDKGVVVNKLTFFWGGEWWDSIHGLSVGFSNGDFVDYGQLVDKQATLEWDALKDPITELRVWERDGVFDEHLPVFDHVSIETQSGKTLEAGEDQSSKAPKRLEVGGGVIVSMCGTHASTKERGLPYDVTAFTQLEFAFTKSKVQSVTYNEIKFDPDLETLNKMTAQDRGIEPIELVNVHNINHRTNESTTLSLSVKSEKKASHKWSQTSSQTWHVGGGVEYEAEINAIVAKDKVAVKADFFWEQGASSTTEEEATDTKALEAKVDTPVKPGKAAHCVAFAVQGKQDLKWSGTANVIFEDGGVMKYSAGGQYKDIQFTDVVQDCSDEEIEDARSMISAGNGTEVDEKGNGITTSRKRATKLY